MPAPGRGDAGVGAELGNPAALDASQDQELGSSALSPDKALLGSRREMQVVRAAFCFGKGFSSFFAVVIPPAAQAGDSQCCRQGAGMG